MRHKKAQSLLASLALGELKPNEQRVVEQHVEGCSACQQELEELLQTFVLLKEAVDTLPARSLTPERTASVLHDELDKTVPKIAPRKLSGFWPMFRSVPPRRWVEVAAVAAIFVIVGALVFPILGHTVSGGGGNTYCISSGDEWEAADAAAYEGTDDLASNYQPSKPALLEPTAAESIDRLRNIPDKEKRASYRKRRRPGNIAGGDADVSGYMGANFPKESSKRPASPREPKRWGGSEKQKEEKLRALFSDEESKLAPSSRPKLRLKGLGRDILSPKGPAQKRALDFDGDGLTNVQEWKPTTEAPRPAPKRAPRPAKPKPVVPADPRGSVRGLPDLKGNGGGGMGGGRELADREATVSGSAKAPAPKSKPARQKSVFFTIGDSGKVDPNALATAPATPKLRLKGLGRDIIAPRNSRKPQVVGWRDRALKDDDGAEDITEIDSTSLRKSEVLKKQQDLSGWTVEAWVSPVKKPEGEIISRTTTPTDTPINESGNAAANYELGATEVVDTGGALARVEPPPPDEVTDTDGDGLSDREEISKLGTNPLVADTDNDGVDDGDEDFAVVAGEKRNKVVAERMEEVHWKWSEPIRPQLPKSDVKLTVEPQPEELNENEILRRGEQELVADELTVQALKLSRQKDYQGAADKYREAQSRLRLVSGNRPRIKAKQAKIEEALARRESILAKGQARDITEDISSVTPVEKNEKGKVHALNLWQKQGDVFMRAGRYGDARDKYEKILYEDPYNTDAIRGLKKLNGELRRAVEETRRSTVSERMAEVRWNGVPAKLPPVNSATVEDELRAGNLDRAKSMLKQIILDTPDGPEAAKAREGLRKLYAREFAQAAAEAADDPLPPAPRVPPPPVNPFVLTEKDNQSTFALEADTASYTLARRYIRQGYLP
ncbi:MAG: von Willebrand factor type A domain-containing protein, partial [Lentisphaeria bacterium]|nr:von Willebrand factor type A domain-containing protein [Lentisphaeria bacterium]